jgi:archaellin
MDHIIFWLKTASGASSVDLNQGKTTVAFQNPRGVWPNIYVAASTTFSVSGINYTATSTAISFTWEVGTGFQILPGQKVRVTIDLTQLSTTAGGTQGLVWKNEEFIVIVKPPVGSVLEIDRVAPAAVTQVNDLG